MKAEKTKKISEMTPEELSAHEAAKKLRRKYRSLLTRVLNNAIEPGGGYGRIKLQLQFLQEHPKTILPEPMLSYEDNINAFKEALELAKGKIVI